MANFLNKSDDMPELHYMQMPVAFFHSEKYQSLSLNAKLIWMLYYNRSTASMKNGYHDELGNVFCYYTDEDLKNNLSHITSRTTISKYRKELKKWGLIKTEKNLHNNGEKVFILIFEDFFREEKNKKKDVQ